MGGGQPGDTGTIGGEGVIDTRYGDSEKTIVHHLLQHPTNLKMGQRVQCQIDWERRYRHMRLHSLIHIVGMLFEQKYGEPKCIGSNISDKGRIDYEYFHPIDLEWLQKGTEKLISEDHEIQTYGYSDDDERRIWEMQPLGTMFCGGTHVRTSTEIGKIALKRKSLGKQGQRIYAEIV